MWIAGTAPEAIALGVPPLADTQYHRGTAFGTSWCRSCIGGRGIMLVTVACDALQRDANLFANPDNPLGFIIGITVKVMIFRALDQYPHLVVIDLTELVEIEAGDNAHLFIEIALGMEVFAKAGADIGELFEPADLFRLQLAFAIDDPHIDLEAVLVGEQLLDPVVELEEGADQDQTLFGIFDKFFQKVVGCAGIQKLGHGKNLYPCGVTGGANTWLALGRSSPFRAP